MHNVNWLRLIVAICLVSAAHSATLDDGGGIFIPNEGCKVKNPASGVEYNLWPLRANDGNHQVSTDSTTTKIVFNVCGSLSDTVDIESCNRDASACAIHHANDGRHQNIGVAGVDSLSFVAPGQVRYRMGGGDPCDGGAATTTLNILCDRDTESMISVEHVDGGNSSNSCDYHLVWRTKHVCVESTSGTGGTRGGTNGFVVFLWLLFLSFIFYFAIGIAYKRMVLRHRGLDQVPHIDLWLSVWDVMRCRRPPRYQIVV